MASGTKNGMTAGVWLAGAVALLALPSAVLAFSTNFEPKLEATPAAGSIQAINSAATPSGSPLASSCDACSPNRKIQSRKWT